MRMKFTDNRAKVERDLAQFAKDVERGRVRALNTLAGQAEVAALREISSAFKVPQSEMRAALSIKPATADDPEVEITARGRTFSPTVYKPVETKNGVAVTIKGRRVLIPHGFVVAKFGGRAFARGTYGRRSIRASGEAFAGFRFGAGRFPIATPLSWGPTSAFSARQVIEAMHDRVDEQAAKVLDREIRAARRGF